MISSDNLLCLFIVLPFAGGFLITLVGNRSRRFVPYLAMMTTFGQLLTAVGLVAAVRCQGILVYSTGIGKSELLNTVRCESSVISI